MAKLRSTAVSCRTREYFDHYKGAVTEYIMKTEFEAHTVEVKELADK